MAGDEEIAKLFSKKYKHLYNSVSYDIDDMCDIKEQTNMHIKNNVAYDISVDEVAEGVRCLKLGKEVVKRISTMTI